MNVPTHAQLAIIMDDGNVLELAGTLTEDGLRLKSEAVSDPVWVHGHLTHNPRHDLTLTVTFNPGYEGTWEKPL